MAVAASAAADNEAGAKTVVVRLFVTARVPAGTLARARAIASTIYERAGVRIVWTTGDARTLSELARTEGHAARVGCPSLASVDVKIGFMPPQQMANALGFARPFFTDGIRVTIGAERVYAHSRLTGAPADVLLGLVLAHEIGHVLKGTDGHSDRGLMLPQLQRDKTLGSDRQLPEFGIDELHLIHANLQASANPGPTCADTMLAGRP
jgi:hypothetical protein